MTFLETERSLCLTPGFFEDVKSKRLTRPYRVNMWRF